MNMRSIRLVLFAILLCWVSYGQEGDGGNITNATENLFSFPVSPDAGKLGLYGNIPINVSSGQMSYQIPLHTIKVNGNEWPITLSYNFGGLLLEDKPSINGMNWTLVAGGTVVREVRGIPDEHPRGYYGSQNYRQTYLEPFFETNEIENTTIDETIIEQIMNGYIDAEADKYTLSVNGINFSFKIDKYQEPVYLSPHNYKITFTWKEGVTHVLESIHLVDDKGILYIFDEKEYNQPLQGNTTIFNDSFTGYTSSWMLSKVMYPNKEEINFSYITDSYVSLDFYASGYVDYNIPDDFDCRQNEPSFQGFSEGYSSTIINRKILGGITSPNSSVFLPTSSEGDRVLRSGVSIVTSQQQELKSYTFEYEGYRDILTSITRNSEHFYEFEYFNQSAIPKFYDHLDDRPYAQDRWGFYNGAGSNTRALNIPGTQYGAIKTPNPNYAMIGGLSKITYPTKGYTAITYEENTVKGRYDSNSEESVILKPNKRLLIKLKSDNDFNALNDYKERSLPFTFKTNVYATISHGITSNDNGHIGASINKTDGYNNCNSSGVSSVGNYPDTATHIRDVLKIEVPKFCPTLGIALDDNYATDSASIYGDSSGGSIYRYIIIPAGSYEFKLFTNNNRNKDVSGFIDIKFHDFPTSITESEDPIYVNDVVGGVRVKSMLEYDHTGSDPIKKKYFEYNDEEGFSNGVLLEQGITSKRYAIEYTCNTGVQPPIYTFVFYRASFTYKTFNPVNLNQGVPVYYTKVKEYENRAVEIIAGFEPLHPFEENAVNYDGTKIITILEDTYATKIYHYQDGYKNTHFQTPRYFYSSDYPFIPNGVDLSMGRVLKEEFYGYSDDSYKATETEIDYKQFRHILDNIDDQNDANPLHPTSLKIGYKIKREGILVTPIDTEHLDLLFKFKTYKEWDQWFLPSSISKTENLDGESINTTETMRYDSHDQLSEKTITKSNGKTYSIAYDYCYDIDEEVYNEMESYNSINTPVKTTTTVDDKIIETTKTEYLHLEDQLFRPEKQLFSSDNNALEERLIYHSYDAYGNPLEVSKPDGSHTMYIWGYNGQYPIAKIENASYEGISTSASAIITSIQTASNTEDSESEENDLRALFDDLRDDGYFQNAMITSYTYDPLIGVTSITDPKGYTTYFEYDEFQRLKAVKDAEGHLLSTNAYNYKN